MASLPRVLALESRSLYLQYEPKGEFQTRVRLTSEFVLNDKNYTKFEVVRSQVRNMVHIRTSYNNKFLRLGPRVDGGVDLLVAASDEPEDDLSKESCTLFSFVFSNTNRVGFRFQAQNVERAVIITANSTLAVVNRSAITVYFGVTDLSTMVLLPKHVSFKGDNNMYLRARANGYLRFASSDRTDWRVHHIAHTQRNGDVRLVSTRFNQPWRRLNNEWIHCDGNQGAVLEMLFRPVRMNLERKTIALLSRGNSRHCMRWTGGSGPDYLAASAVSASIPQAIMTVEEAIRERLITDIRYDLANARMHSIVPIYVLPQIATNKGPETDRQTVEFTYERLTEETFKSSHSWKASVTSTIRVTVIPVLVTGTINMNASYSGRVEWSKTRIDRHASTSRYIATVPPRSSVRVTLIVERGSIDVPYTYKQRDILFDGTPEVRDMDDGLFTGLNTFQVRFIADAPVPLPPDDDQPNNYDIVPPTSAIPISSENYNDYIVPPTSAIPISPENYNDYIVPPTSPIPISSEDSDDEDNITRPSSSKL